MKYEVLSVITRGLSIGVVSIVTIVILASMPVQAWSANATLTKPTTIYQDTTYTFSVELTNTGSDSMKVENMWLGFDWQTEGYAYANTNVPVVIGSGNSQSFSWSVHVPDGITTNTQHVATLTIEAADPGFLTDWGSTSTKDITYQVYISKTPDPTPDPDPAPDYSDDDDSGGLPGFDFPIIISAVFISVGIIALVGRRKRR
ncbi:MAG: hypothetical protein R6W91_04100 [Thermoplasmata archaeon]